MTRATFGVSASGFAANMSVKQNSIDFSHEYPLAAKVVEESLYVHDCLTGADDVDTAVTIHCELQSLFSRGGFTLRKWNSSESSVLEAIPSKLRENREVLSISDSNGHTKTLGLEWNVAMDAFHITPREPSYLISPRFLTSWDASHWPL